MQADSLPAELAGKHGVYRGFQVAHSKESAWNAEDTRGEPSIPRSGRSPGEENGNPLQFSCWENPLDRGAWWATVHGVVDSDMTEHVHTHGIYKMQT